MEHKSEKDSFFGGRAGIHELRGRSIQGLKFRLARNDEADADQFCRLFNSLYTRRVGRAYYRWQFFDTPFPAVLAFATTPDGSLAGCYGVQLKEVANEQYQIGWALDIMVAPNFQGGGLFHPLAAFAIGQLEAHGPSAFCVMANQRAQRAHVGGLGWRLISVLRTFLCDTAVPSRLAAESAIETQQVSRFESAYLSAGADRLSRRATGLTLATRRTSAYTDWRFVRNPWYRYDLFQVTLGSYPFGYLVLKVFTDPAGSQLFGDIVDVCWAEDDAEALAHMMSFALSHFRTQGVRQAAIWLQTNSILDEVGEDIGFRASEQQRYFCGQALGTNNERFLNSRRWFLTMADAEIY